MVIYSTQLYTLDIKIILAALTETGARDGCPLADLWPAAVVRRVHPRPHPPVF